MNTLRNADEVLLAAAQSGEEWAFIELCERYSSRLYRTIFQITKNREDTEDALQDSLLRAYRALGQFDGRSSFGTWFTRIGINSALMILRKRRACQEISFEGKTPGDDDHWNQWEIRDHSANPEEECLRGERTDRVRVAIARLPMKIRTVTEFQGVQDKSLKEIAEVVGISVAATKSRLSRAKTILRASLC
jgi:RNA polymerase sigma factor (sigma-70 family)